MILSWITSGIINDFFKSFYWGKSKHRWMYCIVVR
jgi:hypothetical protein